MVSNVRYTTWRIRKWNEQRVLWVPHSCCWLVPRRDVNLRVSGGKGIQCVRLHTLRVKKLITCVLSRDDTNTGDNIMTNLCTSSAVKPCARCELFDWTPCGANAYIEQYFYQKAPTWPNALSCQLKRWYIKIDSTHHTRDPSSSGLLKYVITYVYTMRNQSTNYAKKTKGRETN